MLEAVETDAIEPADEPAGLEDEPLASAEPTEIEPELETEIGPVEVPVIVAATPLPVVAERPRIERCVKSAT